MLNIVHSPMNLLCAFSHHSLPSPLIRRPLQGSSRSHWSRQCSSEALHHSPVHCPSVSVVLKGENADTHPVVTAVLIVIVRHVTAEELFPDPIITVIILSRTARPNRDLVAFTHIVLSIARPAPDTIVGRDIDVLGKDGHGDHRQEEHKEDHLARCHMINKLVNNVPGHFRKSRALDFAEITRTTNYKASLYESKDKQLK